MSIDGTLRKSQYKSSVTTQMLEELFQGNHKLMKRVKWCPQLPNFFCKVSY